MHTQLLVDVYMLSPSVYRQLANRHGQWLPMLIVVQRVFQASWWQQSLFLAQLIISMHNLQCFSAVQLHVSQVYNTHTQASQWWIMW